MLTKNRGRDDLPSMSVPRPYASAPDVSEHRGRVEANAAANLHERQPRLVEPDHLIHFHRAWGVQAHGDALTLQLLSHRRSFDPELLCQLVDSGSRLVVGDESLEFSSVQPERTLRMLLMHFG